MHSITIPSPVGGWNARDSLEFMPPQDAVTLENLIPKASIVETRPGIAPHSNDLGDAVETLITYHGEGYKKYDIGSSGQETLLCAAGGSLIDITSGASGSTLASGFSNDRWNHTEFGNRIILCNGEDRVRDFQDGALIGAAGTAVYGHNQISNGDFDTDSIWTKGTGWDIGVTHTGKAHCDGTQGAATQLSQTPTFSLESSQTYFVTFTVSNYSAGNVRAVVGTANGTNRSADGTYTQTITAGVGSTFAIEGDSSFIGSIDEVKIAKTSEDFIGCHTHQGRVYYWEDGTQAFHYCDAGSYSGYTSRFDLATVAGTGSKLMFMASWSRDSGAGMDDFAAFYFEDGVIVVYQGGDPASVSDWSLVGRYKSGSILSRRAYIQVGGDVVALTNDGYIPLSAVIAEGQYTEQSAISFKIDKAARDAADSYGDNYGWSAAHSPEEGWLIVNVPTSSTTSEQHVRSTITGSWCKFTNWDAVQFAIFDGDVYFGSPDGFVYKVEGTDDDGDHIEYKAVQAYNDFGNPHVKKQVTLVQANTDFGHPKYLDHKFFSDFVEDSLPSVTNPPAGVGTPGVARHNVTGQGFSLAHVLRFNSTASSVNWYSSQVIFKPAGII